MCCWPGATTVITPRYPVCYDGLAKSVHGNFGRTTLHQNQSRFRHLIASSGGRRLALCVAVLTFACVSGCTSNPPSEARLRISMSPTTDPSKALRENQPLLAYWQKQTGQTPELTIPTSYAAVVEALVNDKGDITYLAGLPYFLVSPR